MASEMISVAALNVLLAGIERYEARKMAGLLETQRAQAAFGASTTDTVNLEFKSPVGAGATK